MIIKNIRAFTLVELIVVITIVGILSTVGFVSYSNYLTGARDSNRISQMVKLSDSLQVYSTTKSLPLPDDYIEITASGTLVGYQGYLGVDVLETIDYTNGGLDPKDKGYYTYYVTGDRSNSQLLALMEENSTLGYTNQTHAALYPNRYPKVYGVKLGALTQVDTNTPVQEVTGLTALDLINTSDQYVAHISDMEKIVGDGTILHYSSPYASCKRIKQTGKSSGNGFYTINPGGIGEITTYCDMEINGGGWTLVFRTHESPVSSPSPAGFGTISNDDDAYFIGDSRYQTLISLTGSSTIYSTYTSSKNIDLAALYNPYTGDCRDIIGDTGNTCLHFVDIEIDGFDLASPTNFTGRQGMQFIK